MMAYGTANRHNLFLDRKGHDNEWEPDRLKKLGDFLAGMGMISERAQIDSLFYKVGESLYVDLRTSSGVNIVAEVAASPQDRSKGLMQRLTLEEGTGMLFIFPESRQLSFWMKETYIPLSIAYLNESGMILNIEKMSPLDLSSVRSSGQAMYALEMNEGWFDRHGVYAGDVINLDSFKEKNMKLSEYVLRKMIRRLLHESFVSHSDEPIVGDHVINNNPKCKHFGSEGIVLSINALPSDTGKTISYRCVNDGENWSLGDVLTKTPDQLKMR